MMGRLIDADALKKSVLDLQDCYNGFSDTYDKACIIGTIDEQPTIEPERKKGEWLDKGAEYNIRWTCSECGRRDMHIYNFCPDCGADMRETDD